MKGATRGSNVFPGFAIFVFDMGSKPETTYIEPQPGFQTRVLSSPADVLIMGGSAGCGKTFCLLMEPLRYVSKYPNFAGIILRREYVQISFPGGLWDKSVELFSQLQPSVRPTMKVGNLEHVFPLGGKLTFDHISTENSVFRYQGPEFAFIGFDELTHFTEKQFFYMLTRNRSTAGFKPLVRASCNPQGSGWVKQLLAWYIYPDNHPDESLRGFPIPERAGVLRYFMQTGNNIDSIIWGSSPLEVWEKLPEKHKRRLTNATDSAFAKMNEAEKMASGLPRIKSFSFIPGLLRDNPKLMDVNPEYLGNLLAQDETTVAQLFDGRWIDVDDDENRLFPNEIIADLYTNDFIQRSGQRYITADIALEGSDKMIVIVWDGWVVVDVKEYQKTDGADVLSILQRTANRWRVPGRNIAFDADGVGGFLKGFFKNSFGFSGGATPMIQDGKPKDGRPRPNYTNLRAQVHFLFRDRLRDYGVYFPIDDVHLQNYISNELRAIKKSEIKSDGKLGIIPKDQIRAVLGRSPDYVDALVMREVFELKHNKPRIKRQLRSM